VANIKSSEKDVGRSEKRRRRNQAVKASVRTSIRKFREAVQTDDMELKKTRYIEAQSLIDRAVSKGVLKKGTGARYKSRLAALL
jgi:small subunit ribosomal protein S20